MAARPEVPAATPARGKRRRHTEDDALGYDEVEDLEDPVLGHVQHAGDGSDDDRFDDAGTVNSHPTAQCEVACSKYHTLPLCIKTIG